MNYPEYYTELAEIEKKISQYEGAIHYLKDIGNALENLDSTGFEREVLHINNYLFDLDSPGYVNQLMKDLKAKIRDYHEDYELYLNEFNQLPLDIIDKDKQNEIKNLLQSPKTILQAKSWIRNVKKYIDKRNRMCFPKELTHYTDESLIGSGGFSRVYKVKNIQLNEYVAVKIPIKNDECIGKSFLRELKNWVALDHTNIVKVNDFNILPVPYIEMEWCDSCLDDVEKPVQLNLALHYIYGIAQGLHYAHQHNIAHLDLKAQNILLKNDIPKITDWGLSRLLDKQGTTTIGISLPYAAPEQFSMKYGKRDAKTDIWQLGILFYYLLTNEMPFSGSDFAEYGKNVTTIDIKKIMLEDESIEDVAHILVKCLARQKKNRYKNVNCFIRDIEKML